MDGISPSTAPPAAPGPDRPGTDPAGPGHANPVGGDLPDPELLQTFCAVANSYLGPVRAFLLELESSRNAREQIPSLLPQVEMVVDAAEAMGLAALAERFRKLTTLLRHEALREGPELTPDGHRALLALRGPLFEYLPDDPATVDPAERAVLRHLVSRTPNLGDGAADRVWAAGFTRLDLLAEAPAAEMAAVTGLPQGECDRLIALASTHVRARQGVRYRSEWTPALAAAHRDLARDLLDRGNDEEPRHRTPPTLRTELLLLEMGEDALLRKLEAVSADQWSEPLHDLERRASHPSRDEVTARYRDGYGLQHLDLRGLDLAGMCLRGADFSGTDLGGADLRGADLAQATLIHANLRGAKLSGAFLDGARCRHARFEGADLRGASLRDVELTGARMEEVQLEGTDLRGVSSQGPRGRSGSGDRSAPGGSPGRRPTAFHKHLQRVGGTIFVLGLLVVAWWLWPTGAPPGVGVSSTDTARGASNNEPPSEVPTPGARNDQAPTTTRLDAPAHDAGAEFAFPAPVRERTTAETPILPDVPRPTPATPETIRPSSPVRQQAKRTAPRPTQIAERQTRQPPPVESNAATPKPETKPVKSKPKGRHASRKRLPSHRSVPAPTHPTAPPVVIADPVLDRCVRDALAQPTGPLGTKSLRGLVRLSCSSPDPAHADVKTLEGLGALTGLEQLDLSFNRITDIAPLTGLGRLRLLNLRGNRIADISPVSALPRECEIDLAHNPVVDITPLLERSRP